MKYKVIELYGSNGYANFDTKGYRLPGDVEEQAKSRDEHGEDWGYPKLARISVAEWRHTYPGEDPTEYSHDILDWGTWDVDNNYDPPAKDWRKWQDDD